MVDFPASYVSWSRSVTQAQRFSNLPSWLNLREFLLAEKFCPGPTPRRLLLTDHQHWLMPCGAAEDQIGNLPGDVSTTTNWDTSLLPPRMPVANEGLVRDSLLNNVINPGDDWHPGWGLVGTSIWNQLETFDHPTHFCEFFMRVFLSSAKGPFIKGIQTVQSNTKPPINH